MQPTSEGEIQAEIDNLLRMNAATTQVTNRAAANGDTVNIDYTGTVDGVAFNGGTAVGYDLTLGSGSFIDGFEDQVVGHTPARPLMSRSRSRMGTVTPPMPRATP